MYGRLRAEDLTRIYHQNIEIIDSNILKIKYFKKKSKIFLTFIIPSKPVVNKYKKYKKETELYHQNKGRVFWQMRFDKHHGQVLGRKWFSSEAPKTVAKHLGMLLFSFIFIVFINK